MSRALIALLVVACTATTGAAQSIAVTGTVVDDRTGQPLPGVLVYVENQPLFTQTDDGGRFEIAVAPGRWTLAASLIGYALLRTTVDARPGGALVTIRLAEGAGTYTERVTVVGRATASVDAAPGEASLFAGELQNLRGVTLDDPLRAVQALPSVAATDDFYSEFGVRGDAFRLVGLTIDGVGSKSLMHTVQDVSDAGSIAMINSETLASVSLLPGSYPQRNGRTLGGQVDLLTRDGRRDRFSARAGLSGTNANVLAEGPLASARGSWLLSFRRSYLDYLIKRIDPDASVAFGFTDAQSKLVFDLTPSHQLQWTTLIGHADYDRGNREELTPNRIATAGSSAWLSMALWRYSVTPSLVVTQKAYATGNRFSNRNVTADVLDRATAVTAGWRADSSYAVSRRWQLDIGGDVERSASRHTRAQVAAGTTTARTFADYDEAAIAASAYGQSRVTFGDLTISSGMRVDEWSATHTRTASPWLTAEYHIGPATRVRGGTGVYRQFADLEQVFGRNGGGEALRPERATHLDVGIERQLPNRTTVMATAYWRGEDDVLWTRGSEPRQRTDGVLIAGRGTAPWVNALDGAGRGLELLLRRDAPVGLSGWIGYAFSRLRYTDAATRESFWSDFDQRHTVSMYGRYRLSNRTSMSAKYRYGSNYPVRGYIADAPASLGTPQIIDGAPSFYALTSERNTIRLPAYSRLDVRVDHAFISSRGRRLVLFAEVANLLGRTNVRNEDYGVDRQGRVFGATGPLLPILPSAGFVVEF